MGGMEDVLASPPPALIPLSQIVPYVTVPVWLKGKTQSIWRQPTLNCYQGIIHSSRASLNPAALRSLTHTVYLQRYASPAVIHTPIQCAVAIVNNAVAIKIFCCVQLQQLWLSPPSLLLPFCLFLLVCLCADYMWAIKTQQGLVSSLLWPSP